jgi:lysophospholipase L1-like esterase
MNICIFGDSIIWGSYDIDKGGWAERLKTWLMKEDIEVYNLGISGNTTSDILKRFDTECIERMPEMLIFAIGINDSKNIQIERFEINLKELIKKAKKFSEKIVFVGLTPVNEKIAKGYSNERIRLFDSKIKSVCLKEKIHFIEMLDEWANSQNLLYDGLHPNSKGHDKIFQIVKKFLSEKSLV